MIGDLLLTFGTNAEGCVSRTGQGWALAAQLGSARLYQTRSDEAWRGFPLEVFEDEAWQIWLLGGLYEEIDNLPQAFSQPEKLNGHFLLVGYEKKLKRVRVVTNRLGTAHIYHATGAQKAAIGTFSPAVARAAGCSDLDLQALAEFFNFGFFLDSATYYKDVRLLPAAAQTTLDEDGKIVSQETYWRWSYEPSISLAYDDAIDQFHELFREVLTSQIHQKRIALPLSGGLDSRSTLAEIGEVGLGGAAMVFPYSYGFSSSSVETKIASQLGEKRGIDVRKWTVQPYLFDQIDRISATVEGFQDLTQCRQAYVVDDLARYADYVVAAHWGDVWLDDMGFLGQAMLPDDQLADTLTRQYAKKGSEILQELFLANAPAGWHAVMRERVKQNLSGLNEIRDLDFKVKAWKASQWSHRWTLSSLRMFQAGVFPLLPFYDNRLVDFFLRIPGQYVAKRQLQIDYLKHYAPDLAKVKWQVFDANLYQYQGFNSWLLPRRVLKRLGRLIFPRPVIQRNWEVQFQNPSGQAGLKRYLLEAGLKLHDLFSASKLEQLLKDFYQEPTAQRGYAVSMLLTLSAWLEKYG